MRLLVIGDVLLDRDTEGHVARVAPDAPVPVVDVQRVHERAGGAGLAARLLVRDGVRVELAAVRGDDAAGDRLRDGLAALGLDRWIRLAAVPRTRTVTRMRSAGQSLLRVDEPVPALDPTDELDLPALAAAIGRADAVLVSDYGGGLTGHPAVRAALLGRRPGVPLVWDPHPRGAGPVPGCTVVTPNQDEARALGRAAGPRSAGSAPDQLAVALRQRWQARAVAVTAGGTGVFCAMPGSPPLFTPTPSVCPGDPVGAGDRFAGTLAAALAAGALISEAVQVAVDDVAGWLWSGGAAGAGFGPRDGPGLAPEGADVHPVVPGGTPDPGDRIRDRGTDRHTGTGPAGGAESAGPESAGPDPDPAGGDPGGLAAAIRLAERVRSRGGTVVATGGCFDLLHAGHVESLQAARRLGDCLVVLLNSDSSIRRIKGPDRPVNRAEDRRRVLEALGCVDAVAVFDADTPADALDALRPQVWAKGGDYASASLPEADLLPRWGGRAVVLPYLSGRSTTTILRRLKAGNA